MQIEDIVNSAQLQGVDLVDREEVWIRQQGIEFRDRAKQNLLLALKNLVYLIYIV